MTAWYLHGTLANVIYIYGIYFYGFYFYKAKKLKILTGMTCVPKDNYKYTQKQNFEVKQILVYPLLQYSNIMEIG